MKNVRKKGWDKNALRADMVGISLLEKGFFWGKEGFLGTQGILKALEQRVVKNNNPTFFSILQLSVNYGIPPTRPTRPTRPTQLDIFSTSAFLEVAATCPIFLALSAVIKTQVPVM